MPGRQRGDFHGVCACSFWILSPGCHATRYHHPCIDAAKAKLPPAPGVHELQRFDSEAGHELLATGMGTAVTSTVAEPMTSLVPAGRFSFERSRFNVELIARECPTVPGTGKQRYGPGVHQGELHVRMCRPVLRHSAAASSPVVTDQPPVDVQFANVQFFPPVRVRSANDHRDHPFVFW